MIKYDESLIGVGTYVSVLVVFGLMALSFWAYDCRRVSQLHQTGILMILEKEVRGASY
jgi:hypothetical protein